MPLIYPTKLAILICVVALSILGIACGGSSSESSATQPAIVIPSIAPTAVPTSITPTPDKVVLVPTPTMTVAVTEPEVMATSNPPELKPSETGKQTVGSVIVIAEKEIRLPNDVWFLKWTADPPCEVGKNCPIAPYWTLGNDEAIIEIDGAGKVWADLVGCGDPVPFDTIKSALR